MGRALHRDPRLRRSRRDAASRAACSWRGMGRAISCTPASRGFASSPKACPARIGCSRISSRWASDPATAARPAIRRRAARRCPDSAPGAASTCSCFGWFVLVVILLACFTPDLLVNARRLGRAARHHASASPPTAPGARATCGASTRTSGATSPPAGGRSASSVMATQASAITFLSHPGPGLRERHRIRAELLRPAARAHHRVRRVPAHLPAARRVHRLRVPRPALRREDAPARRGALPAPARPRRRGDDLRARDHPLHRAGLARSISSSCSPGSS